MEHSHVVIDENVAPFPRKAQAGAEVVCQSFHKPHEGLLLILDDEPSEGRPVGPQVRFLLLSHSFRACISQGISVFSRCSMNSTGTELRSSNLWTAMG